MRTALAERTSQRVSLKVGPSKVSQQDSKKAARCKFSKHAVQASFARGYEA